MSSRRKSAEALDTPADVFESAGAPEALVDFPPADAPSSGEPASEPVSDTAPARNGITRRPYKPAPDPRGELVVDLSEEKDAPQARLLRSSRDNMWIQFTDKPASEIISQLREAGFEWKHDAHTDFARGAWIMPLNDDQKWRGHAHAQEVFYDVVNQIRAKTGMQPFVPGAAQAV